MLRRLTLGTWYLLCIAALFIVALVAIESVGHAPTRFLALPVAALTGGLIYRWLRPKWGIKPASTRSVDRFTIGGWSAVVGLSLVGPLVRSLGEGATVSAVGLGCGFLVGATAARLASEITTPQER